MRPSEALEAIAAILEQVEPEPELLLPTGADAEKALAAIQKLLSREQQIYVHQDPRGAAPRTSEELYAACDRGNLIRQLVGLPKWKPPKKKR